DVVRIPGEGTPLGHWPYLARYYFDIRNGRFVARVGKFDIVDFFDQNSVLGDTHTQFMNWAICNNGAWDYSANTRGYTEGMELEYAFRPVTVRFAEALEPKLANGYTLDWNVSRARSENLELEFRPEKKTTVRLLGYVNHADMGL